MSNNFFKNPNRKRTSETKHSKYVPEWMRLGKESQLYENNPNDALSSKGRKRILVQPQQDHKNQETHLLVKGVSEKTAPSTINQKNKVENLPQKTNVAIGQNKNWFEGTSEEEEKLGSEKIDYDSIAMPHESSVEDEEDVISNEEHESGVIQPGEYGVVVQGAVIFQSFVLSEAEAMIERILFDQLPEFSKIGVNDIVLIKRLPLKVGVLAVLE